MFQSPVYVISDSEMKTLELQEYQLELDAILDQRKRLDEAYERQNECFAERECAIKEIKALSPSASEMLKDKARRAVQEVKETVKKQLMPFLISSDLFLCSSKFVKLFTQIIKEALPLN